MCYYAQVFNGATLIGTHGSAGSPVSCTTSQTTFQTDTISMPEITTGAVADNLVVRLYQWVGKAQNSDFDVITASFTYNLT